MTDFAARATTDAQPLAEFVPYVYGAAQGRPSRGRPEKVLRHRNTIDKARQELHVADGRADRAGVKGSMPRSPRNGLPVGGFYVYRGIDEDTLTGNLPHHRIEFEAGEAMGRGVVAAAEAERLAALEQELARRGVVSPEGGAVG